MRIAGLGCLMSLAVLASADLANAGEPIFLCEHPDGALEIVENEIVCNSVGRIHRFQEWEPEIEDAPETSEPDETAALKLKIKDLEARLS